MTAAATNLGIAPPPIFLDTSSEVNAWTLGDHKPGVVVTSGLVDLMDDSELTFVVGHELGHIVARHTKHRLMLRQFDAVRFILNLIPFVGMVFAVALEAALNFWYRRSELTCDRFGVVAARNPAAALSALTKLAGGQMGLDQSALISGMLAQAEEFRAAYQTKSQGASLFAMFDGILGESVRRSHPWAAVRVWELTTWTRTQHYAHCSAGRWGEAVQIRSQVPSFFQNDPLPPDDPVAYTMKELAGELGTGASDVVDKVRRAIKKK